MQLIHALEEARAAEREQALFYRALAVMAEERSDGPLSERLNELHADEQHHLSRLTARLLELGAALDDLSGVTTSPGPLERWEADARIRERGEVLRYQQLLDGEMDPATAALLAEILETERHHAEELGGKWTTA
jgi:rubrerythrin